VKKRKCTFGLTQGGGQLYWSIGMGLTVENLKCKIMEIKNSKEIEQGIPGDLMEFIGQENIVEMLLISILASKKRNVALPHCMFTGPAGLGKTTLSECIARTLGAPLYYCTGGTVRNISHVQDLMHWVNMRFRPVVFIDEIHALPGRIEEMFYPIMQDFSFEGEPVNRFTMLGGTTNAGDCKKPLRDRFKYTFRLDHYSTEAIVTIISNSWALEPDAAKAIAIRSHGIPRIAKNYLNMCADQATVDGQEKVTMESVHKVMARLDIDDEGLGITERDILQFLYEAQGPVGLEVLSMTLDIESVNLKEMYERVLLQKGYLVRVRGGRRITARGVAYLLKSGVISM